MLFRVLSQTFLQPAVSVLKKNRQIALISTQKAFFLQYSRFLLKKINKFRSFNSQKRRFLQPALLLLKNRKASGPSHPIFVGVLFTYTAPTIKRYCFNFPGTFSLMVDSTKNKKNTCDCTSGEFINKMYRFMRFFSISPFYIEKTIHTYKARFPTSLPFQARCQAGFCTSQACPHLLYTY